MYMVYHEGFGLAMYGSLTNALRYVARHMSPAGKLKSLSSITEQSALKAGYKIMHERRPS